MKKHKSTILLFVILFIGLSLLLYPSFSDWWNSLHQSRVISSYTEVVSNMDTEKYDMFWQEAQEYNQSLLSRTNQYVLPPELQAIYPNVLNIGDDGVMGYLEIPSIDVILPIYHGTNDSILQIATGHLDWTSLPVGGESTHSVISGHRGLPSARLLTDLDKLIEGDLFIYRILDEILIVKPQQVDQLSIVAGKDYSTLVTCTPYGINSHRLLVRGHRIENPEEAKTVRVTADATQIEPVMVAPFLAAPFLLMLLIMLLIPKKRRK